jgi:hypothetical protein
LATRSGGEIINDWTLARAQLDRDLRARIGNLLQPDLPVFGTEAPWLVLYDVRRQCLPLSAF